MPPLTSWDELPATPSLEAALQRGSRHQRRRPRRLGGRVGAQVRAPSLQVARGVEWDAAVGEGRAPF